MALLNYTTKIPAKKSISEIHRILVSAGASAIMVEYDSDKNATSIAFKSATEFGVVSFTLPCNLPAAQRVLNKQVDKHEIPRRYYNDAEQARRIAWRIIKDWLEAQLALITIGMAKIEQIFLPYAQTGDGSTIYESALSGRFKQLQLTDVPN